MCPACMTTAALIATGATSAGGLIGVLAVKLRPRGSGSTVEKTAEPPQPREVRRFPQS